MQQHHKSHLLKDGMQKIIYLMKYILMAFQSQKALLELQLTMIQTKPKTNLMFSNYMIQSKLKINLQITIFSNKKIKRFQKYFCKIN